MIIRRTPQDAPARPTFIRRLGMALVAAALGSYAGHQYAIRVLPEHVQSTELLGMYATGGAVIGILLLRFGTLLWALWRDYRR